MNRRDLRTRVRSAVDAGFAPDLDARREARESFLAYAAKKKTRAPAPRRARAWVIAAAVAALAAAAPFVARRPSAAPAPLTFTVRQDVGLPGARLGDADEPLPLAFSDGTSVTLSPGAQGRVVSLGPDGAGLLVERGSARMAVVHKGDATRWRVDAGPFEVRVTGTKFDVTWEPESATFRIRLDEGSVVVSGCGMVPTSVRAGEALARTCPARPAPEEKPAPSAAPPAPPSPPPAPVATHEPPRVDASPPPIASAPPPPPITFVDRFKSGDFKEAYALVDARFEEACETEGRAETLTLGELARLLGHEARARHAFTRARARFPATREAMMSAFYLGLLDFDRGAFREAAAWFERCRAEDALGTMAREASGRRLEALVRAGDPSARAEAAAYLRAYPNGPHAALAKDTQ
jgi:ferric-dicitrate binding protein FerR (iron transport regulator)